MIIDWNAKLYGRFEKERTLPAKDLLDKVVLKWPERVLDIGCGAGNSTIILKDRWPGAEVIGLDSSPGMIVAARERYPGISFMERDAAEPIDDLGTFDLIISNAALHWIPGHESLIPRLFRSLVPGGMLAAQMPSDHDLPHFISASNVAHSGKWRGRIIKGSDATYLTPEDYYSILSPLTDKFFIWHTTYYHVLTSHEDIITWFSAAGMRPFIKQLSTATEAEEFKADVLSILREEYPMEADGKVIFPFRRLFFTARKGTQQTAQLQMSVSAEASVFAGC